MSLLSKSLPLIAFLLHIPEVCLSNGDEIFQKVHKSVVMVGTFNAKGEVIGEGSGFMVSREGVIATAFHVVAGGKRKGQSGEKPL